MVEHSHSDFSHLHQKVCDDLNMDQQTAQKSWAALEEMSQNYNLEGRKELWVCCAIYTACRSTMTETVGDTNAQIEGNCVSTTQILRACNVNIREFFSKINPWIDMNSMPPEFGERVENLKSSYYTALAVCNKLAPYFYTMFKRNRAEDAERRGKKAKPIPCSAKKLFEFTWCLFICVKANYPEHSMDMVTQVHLLICCLDMIYGNAIDEQRTDIVQTNFTGCPVGWGTIGYTAPAARPYSILEHISEEFEANYAETSRVAHYTWRPIVSELFEKSILKGDADLFLAIVSVENFDGNLRSLHNLYERYVLSCGELDERLALTMPMEPNNDPQQRLVPSTPLTYNHNRQWVPTSGNVTLSPLGNALRSVDTLRTVLAGYTGNPDASLLDLLKNIDQQSLEKLKNRLVEISEKFSSRFPVSAKERFEMAEALYYKMLEFIIRAEIKKSRASRPLQLTQSIIDQDVFQTALIAICLDIVIYAYNHSNFKFPWVLDCCGLTAFAFWRVIELVVLYNNDFLTRDILKHLTRIEEHIFEQLMWEKSSPIWDAIAQYGRLPLFQDCEAPTTPTTSLAQRINDLSGITPHNPIVNGGTNTPRAPSEVNRRLFDDSEDVRPAVTPTNNVPTPQIPNPQPPPIVRPAARVSSLNLLFRKFYKLASVRIKELCNGLQDLQDPQIGSQIWTIFENSVVERTHMLKDRHLDQIIMCSIYVFIRVKYGTFNKLTFKDIMYQYRYQPQSTSQVYRSVFIEYTNDATPAEGEGKPATSTTTNPPRESNDLSGTGQEHGNVLRGDIILFYNKIYVSEMKEFAMRFAGQGNENDNLLLSPFPTTVRNNVTPKKVKGLPLTIHPLERNINELLESPTSLSYIMSSPTKGSTIQEIQRFTNRGSGRRSLNTDTDGLNGPPPKLSRMETLIKDRQQFSK